MDSLGKGVALALPNARKFHLSSYGSNRESQAQFENKIKPRVYVRRITRSSM